MCSTRGSRRDVVSGTDGWRGVGTALAQERELNRLGVITREHQEKLRKVQTALETALGLAYDKTLAPLQLRVEPNESLGILQLLHTPNKAQDGRRRGRGLPSPRRASG